MRLRGWMLALPAILGLQIASADVFNINADNQSGNLCSPASSCGTVSVTGTTTLHVAVSLNSPNLIFGQGGAFGFNVNGSTAGLAISNISPGAFSSSSPGQMDGWGSFSFGLDGPPASSGVSSVSFDVTRTGGFTGPSDIEAGASGGNGFTVFALHIANQTIPLTGFAGVTTGTSAVPEPTSVILFSTVVAGVCFIMRKRAKARPDSI